MQENRYVRKEGYAAHYRDQRFATGSGPRTHRREVAAIAQLLRHPALATGTWLDVPCGAGRVSDLLPQPVVQVDRDKAMLATCAHRATQRRVCASALHLPFADASFAGVLCLRLMQHLDATQRLHAFREFARVTRGAVLFSYFEARSVQSWRRTIQRALGKTRSGRSAVAWQTLRGELAAAGLRVLARRPLVRQGSDTAATTSLQGRNSHQGRFSEEHTAGAARREGSPV